jgi:hypothetical protein
MGMWAAAFNVSPRMVGEQISLIRRIGELMAIIITYFHYRYY